MGMISIRRGTVEDIDASAQLWIEAKGARLGGAETDEALPGLLLHRLQDEGAWLFIAEAESAKVVGTAAVFPARKPPITGDIIKARAHISLVAVKPAYWGRGIGRQLMQCILHELSRSDYQTAQLWVETVNERAVKLYLSLGFTPTGETKVNDEGELQQQYIHLLSKPRK
jgi:ribosomal protein S18 acetylase RimI-like enzyme